MDKPALDLVKWKELFKNPPTKFIIEEFGTISFRHEFVKSLLLDIRDLTHSDFDNIDLCYRGEGRGKSKFAAQKEYVRWWLMTELKLISHDWVLDEVMYYTLGDLLKALVQYMDEPYRQFILDEGDELKKMNWNKPNVKSFISYLRRGRKFHKIININIPNLKDIPLDVLTDRANKLYQIEMTRNFETLNYDRGNVVMFEVPRADGCWSFAFNKVLKEQVIKDIISNIHRDANTSFIVLPSKIKCLDIAFNKVFPFDEEAYKQLALEKTTEYFNNSMSNGYSANETKILNMIFEFLAARKLISELFFDNEAARLVYYRLKNNVNRVSVTNVKK